MRKLIAFASLALAASQTHAYRPSPPHSAGGNDVRQSAPIAAPEDKPFLQSVCDGEFLEALSGELAQLDAKALEAKFKIVNIDKGPDRRPANAQGIELAGGSAVDFDGPPARPMGGSAVDFDGPPASPMGGSAVDFDGPPAFAPSSQLIDRQLARWGFKPARKVFNARHRTLTVSEGRNRVVFYLHAQASPGKGYNLRAVAPSMNGRRNECADSRFKPI